MEQSIKWAINTMPQDEDNLLPLMSEKSIATVRAFHESFPQYEPTPLVCLKGMAEHLGIGELFVKDESHRFGLNAFKALGGSFAMASYIAEQVGRDVSECHYAYLTSEKMREELGCVTFFTATDGNHGRGVAWSARQLGQKAVVRMPKGTSDARLANIEAEGAEVTIEDMNYDDCVRLAAKQAAEAERGVLIQDTSWDGYEKIPAWIMQGYGTLAAEAAEQLQASGVERPSHVFVQAGVGAFASAVVGYYANLYADNPPRFVVIEARAADCLYRGAEAGDGEPRKVGGDLNTIMAGLACGEPSIISWEILRDCADAFVSCMDDVTVLGMRMLAVPERCDERIVSGESGAVGMGVLASIMCDDACAELREVLELDEDSQVLLVSTEGDTDPRRYRDIIWGKELQ